MLQDHTDQSHQTFWRQLLRWLVGAAPAAVSVDTERLVYSRNEPVQLRAEVNDPSFHRINDSQVEARIISPSGEVSTVRLDWNGRENGVYRAVYSPREDGVHQIQLTATLSNSGKETTSEQATSYFVADTGREEYFDAYQKRDFLQRLSADTGGRYYELSEVGNLPEEILYTRQESSVVEIFSLWDMPINLLLLLALPFAEWSLRRKWGEI
jgi:hypothetical protein